MASKPAYINYVLKGYQTSITVTSQPLQGSSDAVTVFAAESAGKARRIIKSATEAAIAKLLLYTEVSGAEVGREDIEQHDIAYHVMGALAEVAAQQGLILCDPRAVSAIYKQSIDIAVDGVKVVKLRN